jgi:hypothetical protein
VEYADISRKLDNIDGIHGLDTVVDRIDEAAGKIVGGGGYDLSDIHRQLSAISGAVASIDTTVSLMD